MTEQLFVQMLVIWGGAFLLIATYFSIAWMAIVLICGASKSDYSWELIDLTKHKE